MWKFCITISLLFFITTVFSQTAVPPAAGDGTETNPYQIASLDNLYWLSLFSRLSVTENLFFIQTSDVDASETINWFDGQGWEPIGENYEFPSLDDRREKIPRNERETFSFRGHYDGQGFKIDGLYINRPDGWGIGLFASISYGATVRNLGLTNISVTGHDHVGGLAGQAYSATIESCFVEGNISGNLYVGGLSGFNTSVTVSKCYTKGFVSGGTTGGIFGLVCWSINSIHNLYNRAEVTGTLYAGGIAGVTYIGMMNRVYTTGAVTGTGSQGPLFGQGTHAFNSYHDRETSGFFYDVLYGRTTQEMTYPYADNTYITWDFQNIWVADVDMFRNDGYPYLSWQTFHFELMPPASLSAAAGNEQVNLYWNEPPDSLRTVLGYNVYRDGEQINDAVITATDYTDTDVINSITYSYYVTALYDGGESERSNIVRATPSTLVPPAAGDGTETNPYQIASLDNLYWLSVFSRVNVTENLFFIQTSDIDASETVDWFNGQGWEPIGENYHYPWPDEPRENIPRNEREAFSFRGHYDGQGYKIDGLYINRPDGWGIGLFASISWGATVRNLGLTNISVTGDDHVGGIAGQAYSATIENCFVEGNISGNMDVGGISGFNTSVTVSKCYTKGFVSGGTAGGLVGYTHWSQLYYSYSHAEVTGTSHAGGIAGFAYNDSMSRVYTTGAVTSTGYAGPIVAYSYEGAFWYTYYNMETTGYTGDYPPFIMGRTTEEMTYPYADNTYITWDFENIWVADIYMFCNDGYPYLSWQTFHFEFMPPASLSAVAGNELVILTWNEPPDSLRTVSGYNVYRDGEQINEETVKETEYTDTDVSNSITYSYYVTALYDEGESERSNIVRATPTVSTEPEIFPLRTELFCNYPNPFNPETRIDFFLEKGGEVKLEIFNIRGQRLAVLIDEELPQGEHSHVWNPKTMAGKELPSGVYLYRLQMGDYDRTRKMLYLK